MKRAVPIAALVVLVAAIVLVVMRPGSGGGDPSRPGGLVGAISGLLPARDLAASDVSGQPCWSGAMLQVAPGAVCVTRLPDAPTRMRVCLIEGVAAVQVDGTSYGPQRFTASQLSCGDPRAIELYDTSSRLRVTCPGTVPCVLKLV